LGEGADGNNDILIGQIPVKAYEKFLLSSELKRNGRPNLSQPPVVCSATHFC